MKLINTSNTLIYLHAETDRICKSVKCEFPAGQGRPCVCTSQIDYQSLGLTAMTNHSAKSENILKLNIDIYTSKLSMYNYYELTCVNWSYTERYKCLSIIQRNKCIYCMNITIHVTI